jgi:hypothetical protein
MHSSTSALHLQEAEVRTSRATVDLDAKGRTCQSLGTRTSSRSAIILHLLLRIHRQHVNLQQVLSRTAHDVGAIVRPITAIRQMVKLKAVFVRFGGNYITAATTLAWA